MVATITGGSGNYDILVDNGAIRADAYTGSAPYTYTWETADGTGTFVMTVTDKADSTKTATAQFAVTSAPIVITHDIAIYPSSADTAKTSAITHDGDTQTISLKVGETYTGITQRVATDGSALSGTGLGCTFTPASSDTVASYTYDGGNNVVITAKAVGTVEYSLESGDTTAHKKIKIVVTAAPIAKSYFVYIQNDSANTVDLSDPKGDRTNFKWPNITASATATRYVGSWLRDDAAPTVNISGVMKGAVSSDPTNLTATVGNPLSNHLTFVAKAAGDYTITITFANPDGGADISSTLNIHVT